MRFATARTCSVISSPARCRSRCMLDAASSSRNTSILLSSHVRLGTWQVFHPPATELGLNTSPLPLSGLLGLAPLKTWTVPPRRRSPRSGQTGATTNRYLLRLPAPLHAGGRAPRAPPPQPHRPGARVAGEALQRQAASGAR